MSPTLDYAIHDTLHTSARSLVLRGVAGPQQQAVIIKIANRDFPSFQQIAQFQREYAIALRCRHVNVVAPLALRQQDGRWTMLQEDIGGVSLNNILRQRGAAGLPRALPLADCFDIALQLCAALAVVHGAGVIHKDINPANLVWNAAQRRLQLIDFGIACELGRETQGLLQPQALEGTLLYMAPEQTGRMNRALDYRADYYAFGATLYELLTGRPPFAAATPMELVHCHLARTPDWSLPTLQNLPGPLLTVLQRLLEKNAEQRYQSAAGLAADLALCRAMALAPAPGAAAKATARASLSGHGGQLRIPQRLYGRDDDVAALLAAFERASTGAAELLLVTGYSGIGKSAVVHEVHRPMLARQAHFVAGKFDQYRRNVPYASLVLAFGQLVRQLLGEPEQQVQRWADALRAALGANLGVLVELMPELALLAGPTEAAPALPPVEAQQRLNRLFPRFVQAFATAAQPLVLFLDDLQWADAATLKMLELLLRDPHQRHLLVIGAYRDNEVDAAHPLKALESTLRHAGARYTTRTLAALAPEHVAQLLADTLHSTAAACAPLTALCHAKTAGNPFFLNQFLQAIHQAGHLHYHFGHAAWRWDLAALELAGYSDNVVDLMLAKLRRLPPATQQLLQLAASLGNRVELATLALLANATPFQTQQILWPALQEELLLPLDLGYKYLREADATPADADADNDKDKDKEAGTDTGTDTDIPTVRYRFLHDRVQQAAYALAEADARQRHHLDIGRVLLRHAGAAGLAPQLFAITEQLNAGRTLITDAAERLQLAELNRRAGAKARAAAAFQAALGYWRIGAALLPHDAPEQHPALWLDLQLGAAEAAWLCGEFDAADAMYPALRAQCGAALQQVRISVVQSQQYQLQGRLQDAIVVLKDALALLQAPVDDDPAALAARRSELADAAAQLAEGRSMDDLLGAAEMTDALAIARMELMQRLWSTAYYAGRQDLTSLMVISMAHLSLVHGNGDFTPVAYVGYASFRAQFAHDSNSHAFGSMALRMANARGNLQARTLTGLMFAAIINHWSEPLASSAPLYDDAFDCAVESGDFVQVGVVAAVRATDRLILGHYLPDLLQAIERDLALMRANGQRDMVDCMLAAAVRPILCLTGQTASPHHYDDSAAGGFSEAGFLAQYGASKLYQAYFYQGRIRNAYLFDSPDAEALLAHAGTVTGILRGQAKVLETTFYAALTWLRALRRAPQRSDAAQLRAEVDALTAQLAGWAAQDPDNAGPKHWLVLAELARGADDLREALRCYRAALAAARERGYVNLQALANELCGEFWLEQQQPRVAEVFLQDACAHYRQWGASAKVAQLAARHRLPGGGMARAAPLDTASHSLSASGHGGALNATLDLHSILQASQALSNEIGLRQVLRRLMRIVCENSGAQVARLLLLHEQGWWLEAELDANVDTKVDTNMDANMDANPDATPGDGSASDAMAPAARTVDLEAGADAQFPLSLLRYVLRSGATVIEDRIASAPRFAADPYVRERRPLSVLCLPLKQGGATAGLLYLENNLAEASFTAERVEFLRMLGAQAMISIAHARLHDSLERRVAKRTAELEDANRRLATLSSTDGLTGLANRRHFDAALEAATLRADQEGQPLAVLMVDVDYFKRYNDSYGHQAGDTCLKAVARVMQASTRRTSDLLARYGGEEFSVVLPDTDLAACQRIAEAMRHAIELLDLAHDTAPLGKVTISVGVALRPRGATLAPDALMRGADAALYQAKRDGRNCVRLARG